MRSTRSIYLFLLLFALPPVQADVLVLVHGWSANADTWIHGGVLPILENRGWSDAGVVTATPNGIVLYPAPKQKTLTNNKVYRVNLPAEAPMVIQAAHLYAQLQYLSEQHAEGDMIIAGHSAGGIVARLILIRPNAPRIKALVTIATPNLGTSRAIEGLDIANSKPFFCPGPGIDFLKTMVGGDRYRYLKHSQGALVDLTPATMGNLIGWLNQQPHPEIQYHAIVRQTPVSAGDELVPAFSQDLNQVPVLRGRAIVHITQASHGLNPADGNLLANILSQN